jgi:serine/threonine protein kinase
MQIPLDGTIINGPLGPNTLRLVQPVGAGAFGVVFKAVATEGEAVYAVKFPQVNLFGGDAELAGFMNEVRAAQEITHPSVVRVVHVETQPKELPPYLVMEFVGGGTLRSLLTNLATADQKIDTRVLQMWTTGLAKGMAAINAKMLHRDLRPENILMDGDTPRIADFGLSKIVGAMTRTLTFKGGQHVLYMAPEGWRLETNTIQIDMYAMGIVLFEMATLQYPYQMPNDMRDVSAIQNMHLFASPHSLESLRPDLPLGLAHVIARLLEKRSQDRFRDWSEVLSALERASRQSNEPGTENHNAVEKLLVETMRLHQERQRIRLKSEVDNEKVKQEREVDLFQVDKLLSSIESAIGEFNAESSLGEIRLSWSDWVAPERAARLERICSLFSDGHLRDREPLTVTPPAFAGSIEIRLFWIRPLLRLTQGSVRFACFVWDTGLVYFKERERQLESILVPAGFTYLLVRSDESDFYGQWAIHSLRDKPLTSLNWCYKPHMGGGLLDLIDKDHVIRELEQHSGAYYTYALDFETSLSDRFLRLVLEGMKRVRYENN